MTKRSPFRYFKTSPEIIRLAVMMYFRFSLSLRNVEDLLHERGIDVSHETVRYRVSVRPDRPYDAVFHGSRSSTRLIFLSGMRASVSASHACGSIPFSLAGFDEGVSDGSSLTTGL